MSCEVCKRLKKTKIGYKTKLQITPYGHTEIVLDRYKSHDEVFIHTAFTDPHDGSWMNESFDVRYCPFCGEKFEKWKPSTKGEETYYKSIIGKEIEQYEGGE